MANPNLSLEYNKIYLVAQGSAAHMEIRVTQRKEGDPTPPATCQFVALGRDENDNPLGTLELSEDLWKEWFGKYRKGDFLPGMETAASAAESMVQRNEHIWYGCPLCNFRTKNYEESKRHIEEEGKKVLQMFDVKLGG